MVYFHIKIGVTNTKTELKLLKTSYYAHKVPDDDKKVKNEWSKDNGASHLESWLLNDDVHTKQDITLHSAKDKKTPQYKTNSKVHWQIYKHKHATLKAKL